MLGAFARMLGPRDRVLSCEQTGDHAYALRTRPEAAVVESHDQPPEGFVERIPHDGGDVFFAPLLETLRSVLRARPKSAEAAEPHDATLSPLPQKEERA